MQGFGRHVLGFVEGPAGADAAGKVREADAEVAVRILVDDGDVIHPAYLSFSPLCRSIERIVPSGMSRTGCGTITRPGLVEC
jgi:hypothetical protein